METEAIVEVLGGRKVLGRSVRNAQELAELVRKGLPRGFHCSSSPETRFSQ